MSCNIQIHNNSNVFYAGNVIEGDVVCHFSSSKEIRGIRVKLTGKEHTSWTKEESYYDSTDKENKTRTVYYTGDNKFLNQQITVCGPGNASIGTRRYPFSFTLLTNLPDTFHNTHGYIEYYIKANVDIPWAPDYEDKRVLKVYCPIDFNKISHLPMNPVQYEDEKTICCCCCASGPITMNVFMDKEAFVIKERPKLKVHILNMSNESIEALQVQIIMYIKSKVTSPSSDTKTDRELLACSYESGVGAHGDRTYDLALDLPRTTLVPNFDKSTLFKKRVVLKVEGILPPCHSNLDMEVGLTLGHIPLAGTELVNGVYVRPGQLNQIPSATASYPPNGDPPPYTDAYAPPYPEDDPPPAFPTTVIGFNVPTNTNNGVPGPSAPPDVDAPSAPSKAQIANDAVEIVDETKGNVSELPPPSYGDAVKIESMKKK